MRVLLEGQDLVKGNHVDVTSIQVDDNLGDDGIGGHAQRAATCNFITDLGPIPSAVGPGETAKIQAAKIPLLVRMGEVKIYDKTNTIIYGGYVGTIEDVSQKNKLLSKINCYDYWQHLDRLIVDYRTYVGKTDSFIIKDLLQRYAPSYKTTGIQSNNLILATRIFKNISVQKAIKRIVDAAGWSLYVSHDKVVNYFNPAKTPVSNVSFSADSNALNGGMENMSYTIDDTNTITDVIVYGGRTITPDIDYSTREFSDGVNTVIPFLQYPHEASDGKFHVAFSQAALGKNDLAIGFAGGKETKNKLKKDGGTKDVLLNQSARTLIFSSPPPAGATVWFRYRYERPIIYNGAASDKGLAQRLGQHLYGTVSDETIVDDAEAKIRGDALLAKRSHGVEVIKFETWKTGVRAGEMIQVRDPLRGIDNKYLVQSATITIKANGYAKSSITCGDWSWSALDVLMKLIRKQAKETANLEDEADVEAPTIPMFLNETILLTEKTTTTLRKLKGNSPPFYARTIPANDGHDAYPGQAYL